MPLSSELSKLPGIAASFYRAGLAKELVAGIIKGETGRLFQDDMRLLLSEYEKRIKINIEGIMNIPKESGNVIVFNHPSNDLLMPVILSLMVKVNEQNSQNINLVMASEITVTSDKYNQKGHLPGSVWLLKRLHQLYPDNIISVPTAEDRDDFLTGRAIAIRKIMRAFKKGDIVIISPEGHIEKEGAISPIETFHEGSGKLMMIATGRGIPTVPVGFWGNTGEMNASIGKPFFIESQESDMAAVEAMFQVSRQMPEELRGPFR